MMLGLDVGSSTCKACTPHQPQASLNVSLNASTERHSKQTSGPDTKWDEARYSAGIPTLSISVVSMGHTPEPFLACSVPDLQGAKICQTREMLLKIFFWLLIYYTKLYILY